MSAHDIVGAVDGVDLPLFQPAAVAAEEIPAGIAQADERKVEGRCCAGQQQIVSGDESTAKGIHSEVRSVHAVAEIYPKVGSDAGAEDVSQPRSQRFCL